MKLVWSVPPHPRQGNDGLTGHTDMAFYGMVYEGAKARRLFRKLALLKGGSLLTPVFEGDVIEGVRVDSIEV